MHLWFSLSPFRQSVLYFSPPLRWQRDSRDNNYPFQLRFLKTDHPRLSQRSFCFQNSDQHSFSLPASNPGHLSGSEKSRFEPWLHSNIQIKLIDCLSTLFTTFPSPSPKGEGSWFSISITNNGYARGLSTGCANFARDRGGSARQGRPV